MEAPFSFMVRIPLLSKELKLIDLSYEIMNISQNYSFEGNCVVIEDNELENLDIMVNCILDTFLRIGLQPDDEPNEIGLELERLNEKINHEYVRLNI